MKIIIPIQLQKITGQSELEYNSKGVRQALKQLVQEYPPLKERLFNKAGDINRFVNIYVNDEDIRFLKGLDTKLKENDILLITPMIAGG